MNANAYSVPNCKSLSDALIRDVLQRVRTRYHKGGTYQNTRSPEVTRSMETPAPFNHNNLSPTSNRNQHRSVATSTVDMVRLITASPDDSNKTELQYSTTTSEALLRKRRRIQQRKYRKKQREYAENLEIDVRKIQEEIQMLEQQLQYTSIRITKSQTLWSAATGYFRFFRRGFRHPTDMEYERALNVLESFMAPDVRDDFTIGPKAVLTRWVMFSLCFDAIFVELQRLEKGPIDNSVVATITTSITISTESLRLVFPHLTQGGGVCRRNNSSASPLAAKLLDQRLVVRGSVIFEWNDTIGCVSKMKSQSDLLTPLLRVLGNLEDVNRVFQDSLVTPERIWPQFLV